MKKIVTALLLLAPFYAAIAQEEFKPIDSIFNNYKKQPGLSVMVIKKDKIVYQRQAGFADIESNEPITPETVFYLASVSKQFTAACIVMLEQQGKLEFDDTLSQYFPDFPAYAHKITITHLLSHTSGLKDISSLAFLKGEDNIDYTNGKVKQVLAAQELNFEPGTSWSYTNSGYWCLVQIVEKASGMPIAEFAKNNIFTPLKMNSACYIDRRGMEIKNRAKGYQLNHGKYEVCPVDGLSISGGGVSATIGDLQKWLADMQDNKILGEAFWGSMLDQGYTGEKFGYAKGLTIGKYGGKKQIEHGGDVDGFHLLVDYYPDSETGLIILSNDDDANVTQVKRAAINCALGFTYKYPGVKPDNSQMINQPESVLNKYVGRYANRKEGIAINFYLKDGQLCMVQEWDGNEVSVQATDDISFGFDDVLFRFSDIQQDKSNSVTLMQDGQKMDFRRNDDKAIDNDFSAFLGEFYSEALGVTYTFFIQNNVLRYKINNGDANVIALGEEDSFVAPGRSITFERDKKKHITGFVLNHDRVKNIKFVKKA